MSRHNRRGAGVDQRGYHYSISYPPDWLDRVRVTRKLPSGRQSTKTLFRNPRRDPGTDPGASVRIGIASADQDINIEAAFRTDAAHMGRIVVEWRDPAPAPGGRRQERILFTFTAFPLDPSIAALRVRPGD